MPLYRGATTHFVRYNEIVSGGAASDSNDAADMRPSLLLAMAFERAKGDDKVLMKNLWEKRKMLCLKITCLKRW